MIRIPVACEVKVINENFVLCEYTTYGEMIDYSTIITPEYIFHSRRKTFGKTATLYRDNNIIKVKITKEGLFNN